MMTKTGNQRRSRLLHNQNGGKLFNSKQQIV
jgi:hypothetical protein